MAVRAVVGGDARVVQQRGARRRGRRRGSPAAPGAGSPRASSSSCQMASGAVPTPPPHSRARRSSGGSGKPRPSGPVTCRPSPGSSSHRRSVPGPTASSMNSQAIVARAQDAEGARQERALVGAPSPPPRRGEHVELPGARRRAVGVLGGEHHVGADDAALGDRQGAPAEGRQRARLGGAHSRRPRPARARRGSPAARAPPRRPGARRRSRARRPGRRRAWSGTGSRARSRRGGSASRPSARPSPSAC